MRITIVCAGRIKERYLEEGIAVFMKRLAPFADVEIREMREEKMPDAPMPAEKVKVLAREGEKLLRLVPEGSCLVVLDVFGEEMASETLAERLDALALAGRSRVTFLIGSAFGISDAVRRAADFRLSFSRMTFTHQMVRLLLVEQIYRAFKISRGEKYHW